MKRIRNKGIPRRVFILFPFRRSAVAFCYAAIASTSIARIVIGENRVRRLAELTE